jgi:AcrR family transcriptional regulator
MVEQTIKSTRAPLSADRISQAALAMLDSEGGASFSLRNLAKRLGVSAPSLYSHVDGLDGVLDLIHARVNSEVDKGLLDNPDWRTGFADFARSYRNAYRKHPAAAGLIIGRANEESALDAYSRIAGKLRDVGVPGPEIMPLMVPFDHLILGSTIIPFATIFPPQARIRARGFTPLAEAIKESEKRHVDDRGFDIGLESWLDAVATITEQQRPVPAKGTRRTSRRA